METILILSAVGALLFCGLLVASVLARGQRPELRMSRETDLIDEADDEEALIRSVQPPQASPIDRSAPILEIQPATIPEPRRLPRGHAPDSWNPDEETR